MQQLTNAADSQTAAAALSVAVSTTAAATVVAFGVESMKKKRRMFVDDQTFATTHCTQCLQETPPFSLSNANFFTQRLVLFCPDDLAPSGREGYNRQEVLPSGSILERMSLLSSCALARHRCTPTRCRRRDFIQSMLALIRCA